MKESRVEYFRTVMGHSLTMSFSMQALMQHKVL
jgi:hypothetical protein